MSPSRPKLNSLLRALEGAAQPIYLVDDERWIVAANQACAQWTGLSPEQLLRLRCVYHADPSDLPLDHWAAALCPPPETFDGQPARGRLCWIDPQGVARRRAAQFIPLAPESRGAAETTAVLVIVDPLELPEDAAKESSIPSADAPHEALWQWRARALAGQRIDRLVGASAIATRLRAQVQLASACRQPVLIVGPPGVGKSRLARRLHAARFDAPSAICAAVDLSLADDESLSAAARSLASAPGTLLLERVDRASTAMQAELRRLLASLPPEVSLVATAREPLRARMAADGFDAALAERLSVLVIDIPPLAARRADIPFVAQAIVEQLNTEGDKQLAGLTPEAIDHLASRNWPGHDEQLAAALRAAHERAEGRGITLRDLTETGASDALHRRPARATQSIHLPEFLREVEKAAIQRALTEAKGNKAKAARLLGLSRPRLYRRMVQLGLEPPRIDFEEVT